MALQAELPTKIGAPVVFTQPAALPHTEFSVAGAFIYMQETVPNNEDVYRAKSYHLLK
jgi:hypothetical protein